MKRKAIIIGIKGKVLTNDEIHILKSYKPWGIILFSRNIFDIMQLKSLVTSIKKIMNDKNYPILIDQEGGAVSRLNQVIDFSLFSQSYFGNLYKNKKLNFFNYYRIYVEAVSKILRITGININTVPVLDLRSQQTHKSLNHRCFSYNHKITSKLGQMCIDLYKKNKILTVVKHIPGLGLSKRDSHYDLPVIKLNKKFLKKNDFKVFKDCKLFYAMTAHAIYSDYDAVNPATHSEIIIQKVIREIIGFKGILMSDDISMKALKYSLVENSKRSLDAGCNLILHCNGNINEIKQLVKFIPTIDKFVKKKTSDFTKLIM